MRLFLLILLVSFNIVFVKAQEVKDGSFGNQEGSKVNLETPVGASPDDDFKYKPTLYGVVKAQLFLNLSTDKFKFDVRNARLGAFGSLSKYITYRVEGDFCASGTVMLAAATITYTPIKYFSITMGQFKTPISLEYSTAIYDEPFIMLSSQASIFAFGFLNRGITLNYAIKEGIKVPFSVDLTMCNGLNTLSFKEWEFTPTFSTKLSMSPFSKFWIGAAGLTGSCKEVTSNRMLPCKLFNTEASYFGDKYIIHSEFGQRFTNDTTTRKRESSFVIQGGYRFMFKNSKQLAFISPRLRFDFIFEDIFNRQNTIDISNQTYRLTAGAALRLKTKFITEFKLNYDKFFYSDNRTTGTDMLSFEATIKF